MHILSYYSLELSRNLWLNLWSPPLKKNPVFGKAELFSVHDVSGGGGGGGGDLVHSKHKLKTEGVQHVFMSTIHNKL